MGGIVCVFVWVVVVVEAVGVNRKYLRTFLLKHFSGIMLLLAFFLTLYSFHGNAIVTFIVNNTEDQYYQV